MDNFHETVWCCFFLDNNDKLLIGNIYKSPNSSTENNEKLQSAIQAGYSHLLITGDFNYKEIDWSTMLFAENKEHDASIFLKVIRDLYLTQSVTQPTRFRDN